AAELKPDDLQIKDEHARIQTEQRKPGHIAARLGAAIDQKPDDPQRWIARGRFYAEQGEHKKADADFAQAASLTPDELNRFLEAGWWVAGPYPEKLASACPPERNPDPSRPVAAVGGTTPLTWKSVPTGNHQMVDFRAAFPLSHPSAAYALNYVFAKEERTATLLVGGKQDARVWLNGRLVHEASSAQTWFYGLH